MLKLSRFRRPRRAGEWTDGKAVTFIVTLAAHRNVTLAAARAGMSRKSAYALQRRDPAFAAAWKSALAAGVRPPSEGDKADELDNPPARGPLGDSARPPRTRSEGAQRRDRFFARLAANRSSLPRSDWEDQVAPLVPRP